MRVVVLPVVTVVIVSTLAFSWTAHATPTAEDVELDEGVGGDDEKPAAEDGKSADYIVLIAAHFCKHILKN